MPARAVGLGIRCLLNEMSGRPGRVYGTAARLPIGGGSLLTNFLPDDHPLNHGYWESTAAVDPEGNRNSPPTSPPRLPATASDSGGSIDSRPQPSAAGPWGSHDGGSLEDVRRFLRCAWRGCGAIGGNKGRAQGWDHGRLDCGRGLKDGFELRVERAKRTYDALPATNPPSASIGCPVGAEAGPRMRTPESCPSPVTPPRRQVPRGANVANASA